MIDWKRELGLESTTDHKLVGFSILQVTIARVNGTETGECSRGVV